MTKQTYLVQAEWDSEAKVWFASSKNIPGLVTEADTIENLKAKLHTMVPEILEANGLHTDWPWALEKGRSICD